MLANSHPGEVLLEEFLKQHGIGQSQLSEGAGVSPRTLSGIVHGRCPVTASSALRLARYLGTTPEFWLRLQNSYDLEEAAKCLDLQTIEPHKVV